uniref:40S ribosomal protein S6 n=1 Tax=Strongyloides papillosus TaxID=174720 RepID=A0A0N5BQM6_STREA
MYRRCVKYKNRCDGFRATYEEGDSIKLMILVRNLNEDKGTGPRKQKTTTKNPKGVKEKPGRRSRKE